MRLCLKRLGDREGDADADLGLEKQSASCSFKRFGYWSSILRKAEISISEISFNGTVVGYSGNTEIIMYGGVLKNDFWIVTIYIFDVEG